MSNESASVASHNQKGNIVARKFHTCIKILGVISRLAKLCSFSCIFAVFLIIPQSTFAVDAFVWTGGTCCGQNQPQYIHNPQALVNYFHTTPYPNTFPGAYTTCLQPPTALGQTCFVYAWYTHIPYTSEPNCPVPDLVPIPANDACANSLDLGLGNDINLQCPQLDDRLKGPNGQLQCFANKIDATNITAMPKISYSGPTALYRNAAYQSHLLNIWTTLVKLNNLTDPDQILACQSLRNKVIAEKGCDTSDGCSGACLPHSHCIRSQPGLSSNHTTGTAFDVPKDTIKGLLNALTPLPPENMLPAQKLSAQRFWIRNWLASPPACTLYWGGNFNKPHPDFVHFQLP